MSTIELVARIKQVSEKMTDKQIKPRLVSAHIITKSGQYNSKYFTNETVQSSKRVAARV